MSKKSVHVFASDFLPFPGCPRTAGGMRSQQVISAFRRAGHRVTFSMPLNNYMAKRYFDQARSLLTQDDLWCCENHYHAEYVLNRLQPDIAIYCHADSSFRTVRRFARDIVHILDFYGPVQFEGFLMDTADPYTAMHDGRRLETRCREMVEKLRYVDYVVTVSERQKYFWSAYCSLAGFSFADLNVVVCPVSFEAPAVKRNTAPKLTVVYSGGFYPWQNPDRALRMAARLLEQFDEAKLHIFGGPHAGLPNEAAVHRMIEELQRFPCIEYHGYRPVEELAATLATAWCSLELMEQNIERELAITGRTVECLSVGTPVIYNDYSTLSGLIQKYNAGWTVSPSDPEALVRVFQELAHGGRELVDRLSVNAQRLATEQFSADSAMAPLLDICGGEIRKRATAFGSRPQSEGRTDVSKLRTLAISPDDFALVELRVRNPLSALRRDHRINGFRAIDPDFEGLSNDSSLYDVILIQRTVPEYIYLALASHGIPFVLDVDDNLLARAAYRRDAPVETSLLAGLQLATVLTAPNPRLVTLLEKYAKTPLAHKAFIAPNALPFPAEPPLPSQPKQLLWIQSDIAAMTTSGQEVTRAVEEFSRRHRLPVVLIGLNVLDRPQFTHQRIMGQIALSENLRLLESGPTSIGIAPLETVADEETLDFVAGKSDLKMLLFDGYGHPGVYSDAPPYGDSPLRTGAQVIPNTYAGWAEALEYQYREGWRSALERSECIRAERHIDRVARESWLPALEAAGLSEPVSGADLYRVISRFLEGETPLLDGSHLEREIYSLRVKSEVYSLRKEVGALRNSLSWKITAPLRKLAKPLMQRNAR
jgi:glycosyltransferase involved in cell wall biosynthesis